MNGRFDRLFRGGAWVLVGAGISYLYLGARGAIDGSTVWAPLAVLGVAAVAVGIALLRWFQRGGRP